MLISFFHSFVNIFAGGRSEIKVLLFVFYLSTLISIYFLFKKKINYKNNLKWLGIFTIISYAYGLLIQLYFVYLNGFSLSDFVLTGNNDEISSSTLWHTHLAKGFFGQLFSLFGKLKLENMDGGGAYIGIFPPWVFLIGTILFFALFFQVILYFSGPFKFFLKDKNKRQKLFLILGYAILSFSILKGTIDGGIFSASSIISLFFVLFFILKEKIKNIEKYYYFFIFISIFLCAVSLYLNFLPYGNGLFVSSIATLTMLFTILLYLTEEKIKWTMIVSMFILFACSWWVSGSRDFQIYQYSKEKIRPGVDFLIYNQNLNKVEIKKIENEKSSKSIGKLAKELNKNITYYPVAVPGLTCESKKMPQVASAVLVTDSFPSFSSLKEDFINIQKENHYFKKGKWHTKIMIYMNPCMPEPASVLNGILRKNEIKKYFLLNPYFYDSFYD